MTRILHRSDGIFFFFVFVVVGNMMDDALHVSRWSFMTEAWRMTLDDKSCMELIFLKFKQ